MKKRTAVYPTVASTGILLLLDSFFASTRMPIAFYLPTYQGAGCLTAPPLPHRRPPLTPGHAIGTLNIQGGRGYGPAQDIWEVEHGVLDIM